MQLQKNDTIAGMPFMENKVNKFIKVGRELANLTNAISAIFNRNEIYSYSQTGEDRIVNFLFQQINIHKPSYLDIGAYSPVALSNTYLLYQKGCYGVCIEPDPELYKNFKKLRRRDVCLNVGIGVTDKEEAPFYVFNKSAKGLNTFSKEQAEVCESFGKYKVEKVINMPLKNINSIIQNHFKTYPNFLSIDVEGLDFAILKSLDFEKYPIDVICAETITYSDINTGEKVSTIIDLLISKDYSIFADTHINTIFINNKSYTK